MSGEPPTGTVTFLFTDIEGSTRRWEQHPHTMRAAVARHDAIMRAAIAEHGGYVFQTIGDAFCAAFTQADDALAAALEAQRKLHAEPWTEQIGEVKVRMAIHTGQAELRGSDYFAPQTLNRLARILSATYGGQIVLSAASHALAADQLPPDVEAHDLGEHRLRDLARAERLFQMVVPDLPASFPSLKTLDAQPNNLPAQPTALIGREVEVKTVCNLLRSPAVRLVTLIGPGGAGKTRLSLQVAADLLDDFANGVYFVPLASISDPALVGSAIANALGVKEEGEQPLHDTLKAYLRERQLLLVLDNFEQVVAVAPLIGELLQVASRIKVLVSSRVVLHLYGEHEYNVPPLALPDPHRLPNVAQLIRYAAVELFLQRAQAVRPDFAITAENASAVAGICARLDGLPLAIELAAARVKLLTPAAILARLDHRLSLLTGGPRDLPSRQQTLRGAIDWSYELLDDAERVFFARLSVFVGGCSAAAANMVCDFRLKIADLALANEQQSASNLDVLDAISSLADKSLLRSTSPSPISGEGWGGGGEPRFIMLETIREYAQEKLVERDEAAIVRQRHAEYFLALAEKAGVELHGAEQVLWLGQLEQEHDNLRAALGATLEAANEEAALRLSGALWEFWMIRGYLSEGRVWLARAMQQGPTVSRARAKALNVAGNLASSQGDYAAADTLYQQSLTMHTALGNRKSMATVLGNMGLIAGLRGDLSKAQPLLEQSLAIMRELADQKGIAMTLGNLGLFAGEQGDYTAGSTFLEESLGIWQELNDVWNAAIAFENLGAIKYNQGNYSQAQAYYQKSLAMRQEVGDRRGIAVVIGNMANVAMREGDYIAAHRDYQEGLNIAVELGDKETAIGLIENLGALFLAEGGVEQAATLFGLAEALRQEIGSLLPQRAKAEYEKNVATIRAGLGESAFAAAWARGRTMSLVQTLAYARGEVG